MASPNGGHWGAHNGGGGGVGSSSPPQARKMCCILMPSASQNFEGKSANFFKKNTYNDLNGVVRIPFGVPSLVPG